MALTTLTGTVSASALNNNADDKTSALSSQATAGQKDYQETLRVETLVAATVVALRTHTFTPQDDCEVRMMFANGSADAGSRTMTVTLTVTSGTTYLHTKFLVDNTITASVTSAGAGATDTRPTSLDLRTTTGTRIRLKKGVRYTLTVSTDAGTYTGVCAGLQLRTIRRRR